MSILKIDDDENISVGALRRYIGLHEDLNQNNVVLLPKYFDARGRYQAPLVDVQSPSGIAQFWAGRRSMFSAYKLKVRNLSWREDNVVAYLHWDFLGQKGTHKMAFSGASEITFTDKGKILSHIDVYDPTVFAERWPLVGGWLKNRLK